MEYRMNKKIAIGVLALVTFPAFAKNVLIEKDAQIYQGVSESVVSALAEAIQLYGYSCKSVSAVTPFKISRGYHVKCNNWTYAYEVEDKGGKIIVTVD